MEMEYLLRFHNHILPGSAGIQHETYHIMVHGVEPALDGYPGPCSREPGSYRSIIVRLALLVVRDILEFLSPINPADRKKVIHVELSPQPAVDIQEGSIAVFLLGLPVVRTHMEPEPGETSTEISAGLVKGKRRGFRTFSSDKFTLPDNRLYVCHMFFSGTAQ